VTISTAESLCQYLRIVSRVEGSSS